MKEKKEAGSALTTQTPSVNTFTTDMLQNIFRKHGRTISSWINSEINSSVPFNAPSAIFSSGEAQILFARLRKAGIIDRHNMPKNLSLAMKGVLADEIARRLNISKKWIVFSKLWEMNTETLRSGYSKGTKQSKTKEFINSVRKILDSREKSW